MNKSRLMFIVILNVVFLYALLYPFIYQNDNLKTSDQTDNLEIEAEKPLHDVNLPDFSSIKNVKLKKRQFFNFIQPAIEKENNYLLSLRKKILLLKNKHTKSEELSEQEHEFINQLSKEYKVTKTELDQRLMALQAKVDVVPKALVLVQAANESAWGTSRFARIGLNFFGIWCFQEGCGMVPNSRDEGAEHEVAAYTSVRQAVKRYLYNINTHRAYGVFRTIRKQLREYNQPLYPEVLATGLIPYSERGNEYVEEITDMIRHNEHYFINETSQ